MRTLYKMLPGFPRVDSPNRSTILQDGRDFEITYASGPVSGELSVDTINWGGMELDEQIFAEVSALPHVEPGHPLVGVRARWDFPAP